MTSSLGFVLFFVNMCVFFIAVEAFTVTFELPTLAAGLSWPEAIIETNYSAFFPLFYLSFS